MKKGIKMRDRMTITRDTGEVELPNGDIQSDFTTVGTFWCNAKNSASDLIESILFLDPALNCPPSFHTEPFVPSNFGNT